MTMPAQIGPNNEAEAKAGTTTPAQYKADVARYRARRGNRKQRRK